MPETEAKVAERRDVLIRLCVLAALYETAETAKPEFVAKTANDAAAEIQRLAASRDAAVREALEKAAAIVTNFSEGPDSDDIADAIRAIIPGGPA